MLALYSSIGVFFAIPLFYEQNIVQEAFDKGFFSMIKGIYSTWTGDQI